MKIILLEKNLSTKHISEMTLEINNLQTLDLSGAVFTKRFSRTNLAEIKQNTFTRSSNWQTLYLGVNKIVEIKQDTFNGFSNLKDLSLKNNKIIELKPFTFRGLSNLKSL